MVALAAILGMTAFVARPRAHDPITTKVTFAREIRAILAARCVTCHSPRGSAPMPLTTYDEVRPWARAIKEQILARRMPKWHAARGYGAFANDPSLTPLETALVVSWVDGGLPAGGAAGSPPPPPIAVRPSGIRRHTDILLTIEASAAGAARSIGTASVAGWSFVPGDPLITSATISSSAGPIGTWVAGDGVVQLPRGMAIRTSGELRVDLHRRAGADFEQPFTPEPSLLRLAMATDTVARRVRVEQVSCGSLTVRPGLVLGVRPLLPAGGSARVWLQRPGATATIIGWFRDYDPAFARTYWLARPVDLSADARLQSDAKCLLELTLAAAR